MAGLKLLDLLLTILHFAIIGFNLFGWVWKPLRKAHFIVVCATAADEIIINAAKIVAIAAFFILWFLSSKKLNCVTSKNWSYKNRCC